MHAGDEAKAMVRTFLATPYSGEARHQRRIDMLTAYEQSGALPPLPGSVD
jgi:ribose 5-phosphate isomerase B